MLQGELGFVSGNGGSLFQWMVVQAEALGKGRELEPLSCAAQLYVGSDVSLHLSPCPFPCV